MIRKYSQLSQACRVAMAHGHKAHRHYYHRRHKDCRQGGSCS
jgi:hypothetical protein